MRFLKSLANQCMNEPLYAVASLSCSFACIVVAILAIIVMVGIL